MNAQRPDPDQLLQTLKEEEQRQNRARLKIFFGMAPGVGKTFAMLKEAQERILTGEDVVVGVVETHNRPETMALLAGLEVLPQRTLPYRGTFLEEFDLDAALQRRPRIILMDELAHSNIQGSRHVKRWQDVWDLLDAGIEVWTTLNVQHLESLRDVVAQITGVVVRENIPDTLLQRADEIELVDIPVEELQDRLKEGKVYVPDQARHAIDRFFRKGNLLALRELALRRTAEMVDADMRRYMATQGITKTWAAGERLLVCVGPGAASASLVRATKRLAEYMGAPWIAAYVETTRHWRYSEQERAQVEENLRLVERLGGETVVLSGDLSLAEDLVSLAQARNVTRILVGKPRSSRLRELFTGSLVADLVRRSGPIDVHVISTEEEPGRFRRHLRGDGSGESGEPRYTLGHFLWSAGVVLAATGIAALVDRKLGFQMADTAMIYVLACLVVAVRLGQWPSLVATLGSILAFDFFFVEPRMSFVVGDFRHLGTFGVLFLVSFVIGNLAERMRAQTKLARNRERRTLALLSLSGELARTAGSAPVVETAVRNVATQFKAKVAIFMPDAQGRLQPARGEAPAEFTTEELGVAQWVYDHHECAGLGTDTLPGARALHLPLSGTTGTLGVMGILPEGTPRWMEADQRFLLESFANQTALAVERGLLSERSHEARRQADREQLRNTLLSSVSHDLRTPLGGITGAATALLEAPGTLTEEARRQLLETVRDEALVLQRLVGNLLDITKLESGTLQLDREWTPLEEVVGAALNRLEGLFRDREVRMDLPADLPLLSVDPVLMEQVFFNLLENAHKYSPAEQPLEVKAWSSGHSVTVCVADHGPGIPEGQEERIFEKLVRLPQAGGRASATPGAGLGLAICRCVVEAHGGTIQAGNRSNGGAQFLVNLPVEAEPGQAEEAHE